MIQRKRDDLPRLLCKRDNNCCMDWQTPSTPHQPKVFSLYRCTQGHYFETLRILNGTSYEEHHIPFKKLSGISELL